MPTRGQYVRFTGAANAEKYFEVDTSGQNKVAVYSKKLTGTVSLLVYGSYTKDSSSANARILVTNTTTVNAAITQITAPSDFPFSYIIVQFVPTGASSADVYVSQL